MLSLRAQASTTTSGRHPRGMQGGSVSESCLIVTRGSVSSTAWPITRRIPTLQLSANYIIRTTLFAQSERDFLPSSYATCGDFLGRQSHVRVIMRQLNLTQVVDLPDFRSFFPSFFLQ